MSTALASQIPLLVYHQITTLFDLHPFNGVRNDRPAERWAEAGVNGILMSLAPIGFAFRISGLMKFGVVYYFVLFAVEIVIWWIPYLIVPKGIWRRAYNGALAVATSNFESGDTLTHWEAIYRRIYAGTISFLPERSGRVRPNLEHTLLHVATLTTALLTLKAVYP